MSELMDPKAWKAQLLGLLQVLVKNPGKLEGQQLVLLSFGSAAAVVTSSVVIGRLILFRGEVLNGWMFSDHLSCRSLGWLDCFRRGVSFPGFAKPEKQRLKRLGKWKNRPTVTLEKGWRFVGAGEAHAHTEAMLKQQFGKEVSLAGEPAGRQIWVKDSAAGTESVPFDASRNPNSGDILFRRQRMEAFEKATGAKKLDFARKPKTPTEAAEKALTMYERLLCDDGHFAGDYGGPMFLMPGLIISCYVTGVDLGPRKAAMEAYLRNHQQVDGGWGTHIECASTMFGTVLSYVSLRLLGVGAADGAMEEARGFMREHGGALAAPSWAKFWLTVLGVHEWEGVNSIPSEMWLLPNWSPFHPGKLWCHCRMVYLPMCYLYCTRFTNPRKHSDPTLADLRSELYTRPYADIRWDAERHTICAIDEYSPVTLLQRFLHNVLAVYETHLKLWKLPPLSWVRRAGVRFAMNYINAEDLQTNYICIGPVNKALNMLSVWADNGNKPNDKFYKHVGRLDDFLWVAEDGMKMQGYNGSQCWDTSFAIQAVLEGGLGPKFPELCSKVFSFLEKTQILSTPTSQASDAFEYESVANRKKFFRHVSKGGWPFSTSAHGWPISDCTAEGLKATLGLMSMPEIKAAFGEFPASRLYDAVHVILTLQNNDGGWATYENNRGFGFYEWMNPSEVFGDIMIDYSYVECSCASMTALAAFHKRFPEHRAKEIEASLARGARFVLSIQRPDGSWYGSWGVCFTYATWFGVEALMCAGLGPSHAGVRRAVKWVLGQRQADGGWGESYRSCVDKAYDGAKEASFGSDKGSGVVQTAWALLALMAAEVHEPRERAVVEKGLQLLMKRQLPSGDWEQEGITGVFNRSCGITYTAYRNVFPIWALGRHHEWLESIPHLC